MVRLRHAAVAVLLVVISAGVTLLSIEAVFRLLKIEPYPRVERQRLTYRKNSKGFRDYEYDFERAEGIFRIVLTGDSFAFGSGVASLEAIFPKRLERMLNTDSPAGLTFEVVNCSQPGWNTPEECEWLRTEGMKYSPDLIIVVYFFNDATYRGTAARLTRPIHREAANMSSGRFVLLNYLRYRIARAVVSRRTIEEYRQAYFTGKGGITQTGLWEKCKECMCEIKSLTEAADCGLLFVIFPILIDLDEDYTFQDMHDIVCDHLDENGIETHSLLPAFVRYQGVAESLWVSIENSHPNERGHEIAAASLTEYLLESDLLPYWDLP